MTVWRNRAETWKRQTEDREAELRIRVDAARAALKVGAADHTATAEPGDGGATELAAARRELHAARKARDADGTGRDVVWAKLHRAELHICNVIDDPVDLVLIAEDHARRNLSRTEAAEASRELLAAEDPVERRKRARALIGRCHDAAAGNLESQRNQARTLTVASLGLLIGASVAVLAQHATSTAILPLPVIAEGAVDGAAGLPQGVSATQTLMWVMGFGGLGGLLGTLLTYSRRTRLADTRWFDPIWSLLAIKVTCGMWFAVIGVLAVATGALVAEYQSFGAVLLLAVGFGYSQQVVTRLFDRRAEAWAEPTEQTADVATSP